MSDALSIFAAARDASDAVALRIGDRQFTFAELAQRTDERMSSLRADAQVSMPFPVTATSTLETLVTLYALLQMRVPALLLHPRLTVSERESVVQAATRAGTAMHADAATVIYTSGTTGHPRGAVLTRSALIASARASAANLGWRDDDCWLLSMPIARVGGLSIITRCLSARRAVALVPRFDVELMPSWIEQQRVTLVSVVPTMLSLTLDRHPAWTAPPFLRAVLLGGAMASASLLRRAAERGLPIVITYGLTETCSQVAATPYAARHDPASQAAGRPLTDVQLRVIDGHIQVRGPMLMAGYLREPALDPDAWFDTGDMGEIDAHGCLHVHARVADLIITGGENVYPLEVERVLEACQGVAAAGVFGVASDTWGHTVAAALVVAPDGPSDAALTDYIQAHLSPHKWPRQIFIVRQLPHTREGKLDRPALVRLSQEPACMDAVLRIVPVRDRASSGPAFSSR